MAGNTKTLRVRIKSVTSTLQLTKAMGLVASSKIRRANEAMLKAREYSDALENAVSLLTGARECLKSPYMRKEENPKTKIIIIAGDRGLAGGYNANIFRLAALYPDAEFLNEATPDVRAAYVPEDMPGLGGIPFVCGPGMEACWPGPSPEFYRTCTCSAYLFQNNAPEAHS